MTTSGTSTFNLDLTELVEEAFERCGSELRSGYDLKTARRSLNLLFNSWANQGINLWTIDVGTIPLVQGTATYDLPAGTVDLLEHAIRTGSGATQTDLAITRISVSAYATIPNKNMQAYPLQLLVNRKAATPSVTVWPVPDKSSTYTLAYWRLRRMEDAGNGANTMDVPFRFVPAMVSGLAYYLSMKLPGALERMQALKLQYDSDWQSAADEDRDKSSVRFTPRVAYV